MENILLSPFDAAPFSQIKISDYEPAFDTAITQAKEEIQHIITNTATPTFENTIAAMAFSGMQLDRISNIFFNLNSAETNEELQKIAQAVAPKLSAFGNDISLNPDLFARVKQVHNTVDASTLTTEQKTLLDKTYKGFVRNGALLNDVDKEKLREMDAQLAVTSLKFNENVLAETNAYRLHVTNSDDLKGLPEGALEAAKNLAEQEGKEGYLFTLDYPSYLPFVTYAENRALRKEITIAAGKKGFQDNDFNNEHIVLDIVRLRNNRAQLLGYKTHADFVLEERMAQNPAKVFSFLNDLLAKAKPAAQKEFDELTAYANQLDGISHLEKWDGSYYAEKLKQERFNLDDEALKPYFKLENVLNGAFEVAKRLYDLHFVEVTTIDKYHADVQTFEVKDSNNNLVALFYADFFPRKGKRNGAWMTSFKSQWIKDGKNQRPHISIVCNFTPPTPSKPSLLTFNEVTTLFHEFGHALHGMLANTTYPSLSGTSVYWDFVELPSQILENWVYEPETLALFAKHYETGATIPQEYITKIKESANFLEGMATLRQLSFGLLDMAWHTKNPDDIGSLKEFENQEFESTQLYPDVAENAMSTAFSHIFAGGYSSGYYSYKWAEVLDADAFDYFKQNGIFNKEIATKFKDNVLSQGGTDHPMTLYKKFRGQEPQPEALLKRAGLL
ncbi:M3 family metallopeptidase [Flavobacterium sp. xlx-214]|uniref:M3 family metallopeptidase n=1 Tax=unclassified Flavobacterium TaxID=196869 RepID=UPI0013D69B7E|nr:MULTISPECIES: M3 family metallopeptidase [unclassified Flavobacterium]MBA5792615.1 M3 family metallopeptidase [Flavobacterium sp. xlx-221]QMI83764.1 M3 family metallopeptidase [Flavobacterium sp. xlx-214]